MDISNLSLKGIFRLTVLRRIKYHTAQIQWMIPVLSFRNYSLMFAQDSPNHLLVGVRNLSLTDFQPLPFHWRRETANKPKSNYNKNFQMLRLGSQQRLGV